MRLLLVLCLIQGFNQVLGCTQDFSRWMQTHQVSYESQDEKAHRQEVFCTNLQNIRSHNARGLSWYMKMNEFGDQTEEEFFSGFAMSLSSFILSEDGNDSLGDPVTTKTSIDWVALGHVTAVKNQGKCGSCWSFSTTGAIESASSIGGKGLTPLSEQQLMDCSTSYGNHGCDGGMMDFAFSYVAKTGGLCSEKTYPYKGKDGTCHSSTCTLLDPIKGYKDVQPRSEAALLNALSHQPVSVGIEADQASFQFYGGGVMSGKCGNTIDHGVLAVGFGTTADGLDYWKIKNSWGSTWGEDGYIRFVRNATVNGGTGQCGILSQPSYPLV